LPVRSVTEFAGSPDQIETEFDIARSEANILNWMQYLPQDRIERMIRLSWDVSTQDQISSVFMTEIVFPHR
jgi:hypothetical protein